MVDFGASGDFVRRIRRNNPLDERRVHAGQPPVKPRPSREVIDEAGRAIRAPGSSDAEFLRAYEIVNAWRETHQPLIDSFGVILRSAAMLQGTVHRPPPIAVDVGGRLKRVPTIIEKLTRLPRLSLSELQDIAGIRAVVPTIEELFGLADELRAPLGPFRFIRQDDYVRIPKSSGYRSIHHVYAYEAPNSPLDGLQIEVQLRTRLQHSWATANEVVGTLRDEPLKSGRGDRAWLRFFALAGAVFAQREGAPIGKLPVDAGELSRLKAGLKVYETIASYTVVEQIQHRTASPDAHYFVLSFNRETYDVRLWLFTKSELAKAAGVYAQLEREHARDVNATYDTVLVSVDSMQELRAAFPNYFADTRTFLLTIYSPEELGPIMARLRDASLSADEERQL